MAGSTPVVFHHSQTISITKNPQLSDKENAIFYLDIGFIQIATATINFSFLTRVSHKTNLGTLRLC
ncbi:hypothetical protein [Arsenophonus sp. ENCA]|uniref:hypothetical protein n=1 Tax=Arsenophonus sp. ENCA TaxID=1987579 RepID=UPI0025C6E41B|nr:hypothetical protein [Arsenophonus sp. ENCA]